MAWLNRTTKQLTQSSASDMDAQFSGVFVDGNGNAASNTDWIFQPDLSSVIGVPSIYWIIAGDVISEMSASEKAAVGAAALTSQRNSAVAEIDGTEDTLRQILRILINELNTLRALYGLPDRTLAQLRTAIRNGYGN